MKIDILTLFPNIFEGPLTESILKRAQEKGIIQLNIHNIRDVTNDTHHSVDDTPCGGGPGMVMRVDIVDRALAKLTADSKEKSHIILMTPQGIKHNQKLAHQLSEKPWLIIICGHYEGYDERIRSIVDQEISIGDFVLTGGEIPAITIIDTVVRLIPGVVGKIESTHEETFQNNLLEYPQYTRPIEYKDMKVPDILLSGNHAEINKWRKTQAILKTKEKRPDLIDTNIIDKTG